MATAAMNPQVRNGSTPVIRPSAGGWEGSAAGKKSDIVTVNASGIIAQSVAVSTQVDTNTKIALLNSKVASSVLVGTATAKNIKYQIFQDNTVLEMKVVNGDDTEVTVVATMIGDLMAIRRTANGHYCADQNSTLHLVCVGVDLVRNVGFFTVQSAKRFGQA